MLEKKKLARERIQESIRTKKENRARFAKYYNANKEKFNQRRRVAYTQKKQVSNNVSFTEEHRIYQKRKPQCYPQSQSATFTHREEKRRAVKKAKSCLPSTPEKRAEVVVALNESPTTRPILESCGILNSVEAQSDVLVGRAVMADVSQAVSAMKKKRSKDNCTAVKVGCALLCGQNVTSTRLKSKVSKKVDLPRRRLALANQHRQSVLENKLRWLDCSRKTRSDAISEATKKLIYEFWASPDVSRPTGNKKDELRERVGPNDYMTHAKQILEMSQTEVYLQFKSKYPEIKIGQRVFEKCKPFFVKPTSAEDRVSCCCRTHVEARMLFNDCMKFRRAVLSQQQFTAEGPQPEVYTHLSDLVNETLCQKEEEEIYHQKKCLHRECGNCGVDKLRLLPEEIDESEQAPSVKWERYIQV